MTAIGRLDRRVLFQRPDNTTDDFGNVTSGAFTDLFTVWGELRITKGREMVRGGAVHAPTTAMLRVRWDSLSETVKEADRVQIDAVNWNIRHIDNSDHKRKWLWFMIEKDAGQ